MARRIAYVTIKLFPNVKRPLSRAIGTAGDRYARLLRYWRDPMKTLWRKYRLGRRPNEMDLLVAAQIIRRIMIEEGVDPTPEAKPRGTLKRSNAPRNQLDPTGVRTAQQPDSPKSQGPPQRTDDLDSLLEKRANNCFDDLDSSLEVVCSSKPTDDKSPTDVREKPGTV